MKIGKIIFIILTIIILLISYMPTKNAFSMDDVMGGASTFLEIEEGTEETIKEEDMKELSGTTTSILHNVGVIVAVITVTVLGVIFILATTEKKEEYKKKLVPFLVGIIIIAAGTSIWRSAVYTADDLFSNETAVKTVPRIDRTRPSSSSSGGGSNGGETEDPWGGGSSGRRGDNGGGSNTPGIAGPTGTATVTPNSTNTSNGRRVFIGDSRTVGMRDAVSRIDNNSSDWSAQDSANLGDMKDTLVPNAESKITSGSNVIILMGVNDLYNKNNYITYINQKANEWKNRGANTYFVSVNPVDDNRWATNSDIVEFNNALKSGLNSNIQYIDTYSRIINSYVTTDGTHYTTATYQDIYNIICSVVP